MWKTTSIAFYYITAIIIMVLSRKLDPTNLAGPGLDLLVYPIVIISSFIIWCIGISRFFKDKYWKLAILNTIGFISVIIVTILTNSRVFG